MWQRVQTLYFAIIVGLLAAMVFGDVATVYEGGSAEGVRYISKLPYAILIFAAAAANLICTFAWKHRSTQIRLAGAAIVILLALQIWLAVDYFTTPDGIVFRWTAVFPLVAVFFEVLAMKGVYADELLVRSSSRLRSSKRQSKNHK